ncbi:MAG: hypothetical protein ABSC23_02925 [Bryobacteraceae bacterium]
MRRRLVERAATPLAMALLAAINVYIARNLFSLEITAYIGSIESSYMAISRWAAAHWGDLSWFPLWFSGTPFFQVYQPGFHLSAAALATLTGWTIPHAFHFLGALVYCAGPVTLFWLCYQTTGRRGFALVAGLLYSLVSPACFPVSAIRNDAGGLLHARRYQVLLGYGEAPHLAAMALLPLVVWALDGAVTRRRWTYIPLASALLAAIILTNWPGTFALGMALAAYILSKRESARAIHWPTFFGVGVMTYLLLCPWITPSTLALVARNAFQSDNTGFGSAQSVPWAILVLALGGLHALFERAKAGSWVRFFVYFAVITGVVSIGAEWFHWRPLPQPNRFQLEFEMGVAAAAAYGAAAFYRRLPGRARVAALCVFGVLCAVQAGTYRRQAVRTTLGTDITSTIEYKMARWFGDYMGGQRVYAPGNVAFWMNMFTDTPQMEGCCEQGTPNEEYRIASYVITSGDGAGARDAEITMLWFRAYGVGAIGISGPASTNHYLPFQTPRKFEGVLPAAWRDGDNAVYEMPWLSSGLAHAVDRAALVTRPPENGIDVEPLARLARAMDDAGPSTAAFRWLNAHEAAIDARLDPGQIIFVQVTYDRGWRATENGSPRHIIPDALGMMAIDPGHAGPVEIKLVYDGGTEAKATRIAQYAGVLLLALWCAADRKFRGADL